MKKSLAIFTCVLLIASLIAVPASAISRNYNSPLSQYTSQDAVKGQAGTILYENFDSVASSDAAGFFATYEEEAVNAGQPNEVDYHIPSCNVALSSEQHHSGSKSLKVSNRAAVNSASNGEHTFICTSVYPKLEKAYASKKYKDKNGKPSKAYTFTESNNAAKVDLGKKIAANYKERPSRDGKAKFECETYYFKCWVYTNTKQTFLPILQYGISGEIWIPNDDYYEVPAKQWTLVGGYVDTDGSLYYGSMLGDNVFYRDASSPTGTVSSGIYPPGSTTKYVQLRLVTKYKTNIKTDAKGNVVSADTVYTDGDFYVDDIALWKVTDTNKLFNYNEKQKCIVDISGKPVAKKTTKTTAKTAQKPTQGNTTPTKNNNNAKPNNNNSNNNSGNKPNTTKTNAQGNVVSTVEQEVDGKFKAVADGTSTTVNLAENDVIPSVVASVYVNNKLVKDTEYSYNPETGDLTFKKAPAKGQSIAVNYYAAEGEMDVTATGDKVLNFTTEDEIIPEEIKSVSVDGTTLKPSDYSYDPSTGEATFKTAPKAGAQVHVAYYTNTVVTEVESVEENPGDEPSTEESQSPSMGDSQPEESSVANQEEEEGFLNWKFIIGAVIAFAAILFDILVLIAIIVFKKWTKSYNSYYDNYYSQYGNGQDTNSFDQQNPFNTSGM